MLVGVGSEGGGWRGGGCVITFLIVRSSWIIFMDMTWVLIRCALAVVRELICLLMVHVHEVT